MVNRIYVFTALVCFICITAFSNASAANITAKLDRNPVQLDESFHLIYEADSNVDDPDFRALSQNFKLLNSSQSTNMRSINGNWSLKRSWDLVLMSKQAGVFTIPSIPFGKDMSPSVRITVKTSTSSQAPKKPGDPGASVYIEVETDVKQAWVQSQIVYTIRLFSNIPVGRPTLSEPETDNADTIFFKLGEVNNYEAFRKGERYAVSELKFAAFAQHSGELTFKPVLFEGLISSGRPRSLFDTFSQRGTIKRLRSEPVTVKILPIPAGQSSSRWLPARQLTLISEWSDDITQLKAGEPVTRTVTLIAKGLTAEQLPTIKPDDIQGLKQYSDQPTLKNENSSEGVTGTRTMKMALIPTGSGVYKIPPLTIPWWNIRTGTAELATLPATELKVTGVANTLTNPPPTPTHVPNSVPATSTQSATADTGASAPAFGTQHVDFWRWLSLALGVGWLFTTLLFLLNRRRQAPRTARQTPLNKLAREVRKHTTANQPTEAREALLLWAKAKWPAAHIANLADVAQHSHKVLGTEIRSLNSVLYSATPAQWQGKALAKAFEKYKNYTAT